MAAGANAQSTAPQKPAAKALAPATKGAPPARLYYDAYEPLQRTHLKRESCRKDEESVGAHCVKKCNPSYELKTDVRPMRCVGTRPLPPGVLPGPIRSDFGVQPMPAQPANPPKPKPGA
jgi:hypothetical protein